MFDFLYTDGLDHKEWEWRASLRKRQKKLKTYFYIYQKNMLLVRIGFDSFNKYVLTISRLL